MSAETGKSTYFEGTPIPSSVLLVIVLLALTWKGSIGADLPGGIIRVAGCDLHLLSLLYVLSGSLMISKTVHIPKP
jgi:CDP-diacylglycerol--serine O-phosphatidyltransferase